MFVKHIGLYFTGNAIAALLVFGRDYSLELTAMQCPSKTQLRERKHMKDYLKRTQCIHPTRNINNFPGLSQVNKELCTVHVSLVPCFSELKCGLC